MLFDVSGQGSRQDTPGKRNVRQLLTKKIRVRTGYREKGSSA